MLVEEAGEFVQVQQLSSPGGFEFMETRNGPRGTPEYNAHASGLTAHPHLGHDQHLRVQRAAGIEPLRRIYDLRHTFATFALRAGISTFDLSRYMGASLTMIDRHYGHLARDGREHAIRLLDNDADVQPMDVRC